MNITFFDHGYGVFDRARRVGPAKWNRFDLIWLHEGAIELTVMQRRLIRVDTGCGLLLYPDTHFVGRAVTPAARASVQHFDIANASSELFEPFKRLLGKRAGFELFTRAPAGIEVDIERAISLSEKRQTKAVRDMRIALLAVMLAGLVGVESTAPADDEHAAAFDELFAYLDENLHRAISLDEMAATMQLSTSHFRAMFRERFSLPPGRYLSDLRMRRAATLLRETTLPIKTVAQRVGFDELPNFYRAFRHLFKQTPAAFRRQTAVRG